MGKIYEPKRIRNVALSGAPNAGKTTLAEALLFVSGQIPTMGSVDKGTTVMDFEDEEIAKKMSLHTSLAYTEWNNVKINLLDTPGIPDLVGEVRSAFRAVEGIIFVVSGVDGITIDTEKDWHFADDYQIARIVFINQMDKPEADFFGIAEDLEKKFKKPVIPLELPLIENGKFVGTFDLVSLESVFSSGKEIKRTGDIPSSLKDKIGSYREKLFDAVAETDDTLIEKYLSGETLTPEEVERGLRSCTMNNKFIPIFCGSALHCIGIQPLLDVIVQFLPSPLYVGEEIGKDPNHPEHTIKRHPDPEEPFSAFVFKTYVDPYAGKLSFARILSGKIRMGDEILNVRANAREKIAHLYMINGKNLKEIEELEAGDIAVFAKLDSLHTGDTITEPTKPLLYEPVRFPSPSYFLAIHAKDRKLEDKLAEIFHQIHLQDPTFTYEYNDITKEMVISCIGEIQAKHILDYIQHHYKIEFETRVPRIAYKETITAKAEGHYKHKKQTGGHGQYGEVYLRVEPLKRNEGFLFTESIFGGAIPKNYVPAIEKGCREACESGVIAGYPVVDIKVDVYDGSYHEVDSSDMSFKIAGLHAMKLAIEAAKPVLLEPIARVRVYVDEDAIGSVMGDLSNRRGKVQGMDKISEDVTVINAFVPYAEMLAYAPALNALTSGRGRFDMEISHYDILPQSEYEKAKKQAEQMRKEQEEAKA
ncbi:MAG: elongation factor G [Brevinematales bacterium]|nr:elongation factor G [Brevinematales bacterium]